MAALIPAIGTCVSRMTGGERRLAYRLEQKLEADWLLWYDVPLGPRNVHPDFVVFNPRRGLLVLEVKDWKLDTIRDIDRQSVSILTPHGLKRVVNPLEQARQYAHEVSNLLQRDPQLTINSGRLQGSLLFPWSYGVVLANISRKQFDSTNLGDVIEAHRVICQDEMTESIDAEAFQERLWGMLPFARSVPLSLPQIDRIRWHLFPEIRIVAPVQSGLFDEPEAEIPDIVRVMDIQQEQLARSLGEGHRVIHGVAGSGKTLILGYRAEHLAKVCARPILVLCYNRTLAKRLARSMAAKGLADKVLVHSFHQWCRAQLVAYDAGLPENGKDNDFYASELVDRIIRAVDANIIPAGQYDAVLIDEGHDFQPEWLKLVTQMVNPSTNSLLVLYDDAQSIYGRDKRGKLSFKSLGIQAQGRTTILKINYRNTQEVLELASGIASDLLKPSASDEDGVPLVAPVSAGRHGPKPLLIKLPSIQAEADYIAKHLKEAHKTGTPWSDMAVIYRDYPHIGKPVLATLRKAGIPVTYQDDITFAEKEDTVKFLTMHSCKGLEFPLVAIPGAGRAVDEGRKDEEARLLYVAMTRATRELMICEQ
ncbi:DEAD/DEAH box helicase [Azonexus sp.]|uniref:DEAD/DEAH box helicase n=1 Tax=Azonexus sp. TaxID=1872668 RepID=UPI0027BAB8E0|nr:3'-5' exonuclease [Azonexus sp.]